MNKEQMVKALVEMMDKLRTEREAYNKSIDDKIAGLEISYEAFTGETAPKTVTGTDANEKPEKKRSRSNGSGNVRRGGRRGMKIDRQASEKTLAFLQERQAEGKNTTVKGIGRKFNITTEAAGQRCLKLIRLGWAVRTGSGEYAPAEPATAATNGAKSKKNNFPISSYGFPGQPSSPSVE